MKKIFLLFFVIVGLLFLGSTYYSFLVINPHEIILNQVIQDTNQKLKERYDLTVAGIGRYNKDRKIESITIDFNRFLGPVSREKGREIIIDCVEEYINAINQKESLGSFLFEYPISEKNVVVMMTHWNKDKTLIFHPHIATICKFSNKIVYYTIDPEDGFKYQTETRETYEEAKSLAKKITPRD